MKLREYKPGSCCDPTLDKFLEFEVRDLSEIPSYLPRLKGHTFHIHHSKNGNIVQDVVMTEDNWIVAMVRD